MSKDNEARKEVEKNSGVDDESYGGSAMLESHEFNEKELDILKGDTVGDTVYSSKWIINTLISLSKVHEEEFRRSSDLEDSLCELWDMSGEKDVVKYLLENDFLNIAEFVLRVSNEKRLIEIIIGIVGNMCCEISVLDAFENKTDLINIVLRLLPSDDSLTLIQVLRILQAALWYIQGNSSSVWLSKLKECEFLSEVLTFILNSSINDDLLLAVLEFISTISSMESLAFTDLFNVDLLIPALLESISQIMRISSQESHSRSQIKSIENWLVILSTIIKGELLKFEDGENDEKFKKLKEILYQILRPYISSFNLIPLNQQVLFCIQQSVEIMLIFQRNEFEINAELNWVIIQIIKVLSFAMEEFKSQIEEDPENAIKVLSNYLRSYWLEILALLNRNGLSNILRLCDKETLEELMKITSENTSNDNVDKLSEIASSLSL